MTKASVSAIIGLVEKDPDLGHVAAARDTIGDLALADATLSELLTDILGVLSDHLAMFQRRSIPSTTHKAAEKLASIQRREPGLFPSEAAAWLIRVKEAAIKRNDILHAAARDRCVSCKQGTDFRNRGRAVDRSPETVRAVADQIDALTIEGVQLARDISGRVNARLRQEAAQRARDTGTPQFPAQVLIGQNVTECATCTGTGHGRVEIQGIGAVAIMPPGTDMHALAAALRGEKPGRETVERADVDTFSPEGAPEADA